MQRDLLTPPVQCRVWEEQGVRKRWEAGIWGWERAGMRGGGRKRGVSLESSSYARFKSHHHHLGAVSGCSRLLRFSKPPKVPFIYLFANLPPVYFWVFIECLIPSIRLSFKCWVIIQLYFFIWSTRFYILFCTICSKCKYTIQLIYYLFVVLTHK